MKKLITLFVLGGALVFTQFSWSSCSSTKNTVGDTLAQRALANLTGTTPGTALSGTAQFNRSGKKVQMKLQLTVPSKANQSVAVHIHEHADCGDMGKHAGGHWNPTNQSHGKWGTGSFHSGDIGNVSLDASGKGTMEIQTDLWSLGGDATTNILNKTIIVHAGVDDYTSQPAGNSGDRIGCGVIAKQVKD